MKMALGSKTIGIKDIKRPIEGSVAGVWGFRTVTSSESTKIESKYHTKHVTSEDISTVFHYAGLYNIGSI